MKIGIDARLWDETGVGRYVRNLLRHLAQLDKKNSYVIFFRNPQNFQFPISNFQSTSWKVVKADVRWHSLDEQLRFPSIIEKEHLDLVHFPYFSVPILYPGKFIVTIHDLIPLHFDTGRVTTLPLPLYKIKRLGYKFVLRQVVKKASKILAVSNATKDEVVKHLKIDPQKVVVTYEGVDQQIAKSKWRIEKNDKLSAISHKQYFLYVGNAYPHKNLERFVEAFKNVILSVSEGSLANARRSNKLRDSSATPQNDMRLILVGKEDYFYKRLKEQVREMGLEKQIIFCGEVSDSELASLYQNAHALVIPSLMEGFGLPSLEAMANNCLVIASDLAALREVCTEAAVYFNPYDSTDIAQKLTAVINQSNSTVYQTKREEGVERVKLFSWKKMAEETLKIYEEVIH